MKKLNWFKQVFSKKSNAPNQQKNTRIVKGSVRVYLESIINNQNIGKKCISCKSVPT